MQASPNDNFIQAVIVDDEQLAIKGLEMLLYDYRDIHVAGIADNIDSAVNLIQQKRPDLIFLDVQLHGETGFDLFERMAVASKVVFVTAFDEYAIRAFEVNALDYLLKPVSRERFEATISRLFDKEKKPSLFGQRYTFTDMVSLNTGRCIKFIKASEITSIHAVGDYSRVATIDGKNELVYRTLKEWEQRLPLHYFVRIHRSAIVNMAQIDRVEPTTSNRFAVYLHHQVAPIAMSQRYSARFRKALRNPTRTCEFKFLQES